MNGLISRHLQALKRALLISDLKLLFWALYAIALGGITLALVVESVFYLSSDSRWVIWQIGFFLLVLVVLVLAIGAGLVRFNLLGRYRPSRLARRLGGWGFNKPDRVINALQLERGMNSSAAPELSRAYVSQVERELGEIDFPQVLPRRLIRRGKIITIEILSLLLVLFLVFRPEFATAAYRWVHPRTHFPVPRPYKLMSNTGDANILGGENVRILIQSIGATPDSIRLELVTTSVAETDSASGEPMAEYQTVYAKLPGLYEFELEEIYQDYIYRAYVSATHFWQPWQEVTSAPHRITVTDRPAFEDFTITVIPPDYSRLKPYTQQGNQANIQGLAGSTVSVRLTANRLMSEGYLQLNDQPVPLTIRGRRAEGAFTLTKPGQFTTHIRDRRRIANRDPIPYHLQILPDLDPDLQVIQPELISELGDDMTLPIQLAIADDFGFSNLQVAYEVRRPSFIDLDPYTAIFTIPDLTIDDLNQEIATYWDLSELDLFPEDEVQFHFELYDNDIVSGPKKAVSATYLARLPSLADLFESMEAGENELQEDLALDQDELRRISRQLEQAELELLKSEDIDWEQQQAMKKTVEAVRREVERLEQFAEAMEKLKDDAEKHGLFSEDMLDKFGELQELVSELISPELMADLERVNQALEKLDNEELLNAMDDLAANLDQVEQQLDRFLDIFRRVRAEQKMEEVRERLEQLVEQQEHLNQEIDQAGEESDPSDLARLAFEAERNRQEFDNIRETMDEAAQMIEEFSPETAEDLADLSASELAQATEQAMQETAAQMQNQNPSAAQPTSSRSLQQLQDMQQQFMDLQAQFQQQTVNEMADRFRGIMRDVLTLSKAQEALRRTASGLSRNSARLGELAARQQMYRDQLGQISESLLDLSRETFAVTPAIGKAVGMANYRMTEAQANFVQRNGNAARESQQQAMAALNEAAQAIHASIGEMQQSGSSSGFQQFMQRMQAMSRQQQGINNQGMQLALGQMAAAAQQGLMQRLLSEQQGVRKSLDELMSEMRGSNQGLGDLQGIADEMDEVIKDLQRRRYTRRTQERQQRILSRMLDSQKSLTRRDFKKERKSKTATAVTFAGPGGLPDDLGQRRDLTLEALNRAMKSSYPQEYKTMIRAYFNSLIQAEAGEDPGE